MKKILSFFRILLIGSLWTFLFLIIASLWMGHFWNFNILSAEHWEKIRYFWTHGGVIKQQRDLMFSLNILILPFIWVYVWRKLLKINYLNVLLWPINAYNNWALKRLKKEAQRIVLRNIQPSAKEEDALKAKIAAIKPQPPQAKQEIRGSLSSQIAMHKNENK